MKSRILFLLLCMGSLVYGQNKPGKPYAVKKAKDVITLDGQLIEQSWKDADIAKDFFMFYPIDSAEAEFQTEARVTFNDHFFYISFVCYDDGTPNIVQSLRRDFDFENNDNAAITIGPYNDRINGFYFAITPLGVQLEGTVNSGGASDESFSATWDNKWYSKVVRSADRWVAELAIPFKSIRYKNNVKEWNVQFMRWDRKRNVASTWVAVPIQYSGGSFAYSGQLVWEDPLPKARPNVSVIPYLAGGLSQDREVSPAERDSDLQFGGDTKIGITPSLNLDLTYNPDFSQVEVDRQVINLTRFEFRFPERRQFFLENSDLFEKAGFPEARPFFSRRVGLTTDTSENIQKVPILYGARLSGSINEKWRVSAMNMHTREKLSLGLPDQNYTVATLLRNFGSQSNVSVTYVDKHSIGISLADTVKYFNDELVGKKMINNVSTSVLNRYNRVFSVDAELLSKDNKWYGSLFYSKSFDPIHDSGTQSGGAFGRFNIRNMDLFVGQTVILENYNAEAGFVPSYGVYPGQLGTFVFGNGRFFPKKGPVINMGPSLQAFMINLPAGGLTDQNATVGYEFNFRNTSQFEVGYNYTLQRLTSSFNPIDDDLYTNYQEGDQFKWHTVGAEYNSDQRKVFNYNIEAAYGGFYNGTNLNLNGQLNFRYQPFGSFSLRFDYNDLKLPGGYGEERLFLIGPRLDLTFTDKLFLTSFMQYNNLADNVNLNTRFQWRYSPASDFFIVYTENYLPGSFNSKNRALVFKFTYWLNI